jgi:hypothetical protein
MSENGNLSPTPGSKDKLARTPKATAASFSPRFVAVSKLRIISSLRARKIFLLLRPLGSDICMNTFRAILLANASGSDFLTRTTHKALNTPPFAVETIFSRFLLKEQIFLRMLQEIVQSCLWNNLKK